MDHYNEYQIYDSSLWIKIAFNEFTTKQYNREKVTDAIPAKNFADSHWYNFYKAVKWYKNQFLREAANQGVLINI